MMKVLEEVELTMSELRMFRLYILEQKWKKKRSVKIY